MPRSKSGSSPGSAGKGEDLVAAAAVAARDEAESSAVRAFVCPSGHHHHPFVCLNPSQLCYLLFVVCLFVNSLVVANEEGRERALHVVRAVA